MRRKVKKRGRGPKVHVKKESEGPKTFLNFLGGREKKAETIKKKNPTLLFWLTSKREWEGGDWGENNEGKRKTY